MPNAELISLCSTQYVIQNYAVLFAGVAGARKRKSPLITTPIRGQCPLPLPTSRRSVTYFVAAGAVYLGPVATIVGAVYLGPVAFCFWQYLVSYLQRAEDRGEERRGEGFGWLVPPVAALTASGSSRARPPFPTAAAAPRPLLRGNVGEAQPTAAMHAPPWSNLRQCCPTEPTYRAPMPHTLQQR
jgi:hypothetical protein